MIKKAYLENWKTHRKSEFEFGKGTNVIVGIVGSGKSAIMDAICFALYGTFPALNARRVALDEVIMSKPSEMQEAAVKLFFDYGGQEYRVERVIRRKGMNEAKLFREERLIAGPKTTDVTKKVEEITEVSYDLFSRAVYSEQNQIDYFLRLNPSQRKEKFDELLQINRYEKGRANAVKVVNLLKASVQDRKNLLEKQKGIVKEKEMKEAVKKCREKEEEIKEFREKGKKAREAVAKIEEEVNKLEKKEKEFNSLKELLIKSKTKEEGLAKTIEEAKKELEGKEEGKIKEEEAMIMEGLEKFAEKRKKLNEEKQAKEKQGNELMQKIKVNESKVDELKNSLQQLSEAKAICPVCRRSLKEHTKEELFKENEEEQKKLNEEMEGLIKEKKGIEKLIEGVEKEGEIIEGDIEKAKERQFKLRQLVERAALIEKQSEELKGLKKEIEKIEKNLKMLEFDETWLKEKRNELIEKRAAIDAIKREIESREELIAEIKQSIERMEEAKKQLKELETSIAHQEKIIGKTALFINALKATQSELRLSLIDTVNEAMHDIWGRIYPYQDYVSAKIEILNGDYEIMVKERSGRWVRVEGILSGGERSAAALTIRIAISLVLTQNLSWLILDEPTHNLDTETVNGLSRMMKSRLPELVGQIFIITHDPLMEKAASSNLYILERDKAADGVTKLLIEPIK